MNLLHLKYAVEVAKTNSITKAAENLFMGQPSLSRAIKELEDSIGISIFKRTPRGIVPTPRGEEFLSYAYHIIEQVQEVEDLYRRDEKVKLRFDISVPRAGYISYAFKKLVSKSDLTKEIDFSYKETNSLKAMNTVSQSNYSLGIIRYQKKYEKHFMRLLKDRDQKTEDIWEFEQVALMSQKNPLSSQEIIRSNDFSEYIQIVHGDPYVPSATLSETKKSELTDNTNKHIYIYERGSQLELLCDVPYTYIWSSPIPKQLLKRHSLVQRKCQDSKRVYKDVLIFQKNYKFTDVDHAFIEELKKARDEVMKLKIT